jgi:hypothetical protein
MKRLLTAAIICGSAALSASAGAEEGRWCAIYGNAEGGKNCYFATHRQCMADVRGKSGWCQLNPDFGHVQYLRYR